MRQSALLRSGAVLLLVLAPLVVWVTMPAMGQQRGVRQRPTDRIAGTVTSITETSLTAQPLPGWSGGAATVMVGLNDSTRYCAMVDTTSVDLARGALAVALYDGEGDGAVARGMAVYTGGKGDAERVAAAAALAMEMLMRDLPGGDNDRRALLKRAIGRIRSTDSGSVVIAAADGDIALRLAGDTLLRRLGDALRTDIKVDAVVAVMLAADRGESDPRLAKVVVLIPPSLIPRPAQ